MSKYIYDYPMPSVTVDAVLFCCGHVLLIKRRDEPFKDCWALPGGFMNMNETLIQAVIRETKEETNINIVDRTIMFVGPFDAPDRDTRGRVVSFAFSVFLPLSYAGQVKAGDDAKELDWFPMDKLPKLAFDHSEIIKKSIDQRNSIKK